MFDRLLRDLKIEVGQKASYERTFTEKDVEIFIELSGDKGRQHVERDSEGRLMVHGLLTATLPTKLGGDINYIAREISYEFLRPVFTGDKIRVEGKVTAVQELDQVTKVSMKFSCYNQDSKEVLNGKTCGIIRKSLSQSSIDTENS